ncbi:MAG: 30S ribosomal protein S1 [Terriglobia bacterium]
MSPEDNHGASQAEGTAPATPDSSVDAETSAAEMQDATDLLEGMQKLSEVAEGRLVRGRILKITDSDVLVDIGLKSEGAISRQEFLNESGELTVHPGDEIEVQVESYDENEGTFTVSRRKATSRRIWEDIEEAFRNQSNLKGRVIERTKGGLIVDVGLRAFLPGSQADIRPLRNLESLIGQEIEAKVIKVNKARNNLVVSRKLALEEDLNRRKSSLMDRLQEGAVLTGRVKNITDYGAFVDLGGLDGLLHIGDLAWGRVSHASEVVEVGQELEVKVLKYDPEKGRVSLGLKQLMPDPWDSVASRYAIGQKLTGRVVSLTDYGAFVELEPGIEGLVHVSEMAWSKRLKHPSKLLKAGSDLDVVVLEVHEGQRRISLSLKRTMPDPWETLGERYAVGMTVEGRVRNLTDFGAFVEIEDGVDGLVHVSELSWNRNVKHPSEILKKGQRVAGVVLNLDPSNRRLSLGLKQLQPDHWEEFLSKTQVNALVRGKVVRIAQFGAFVELEEGIEGLCHKSEMDENFTLGGRNALAIGNEYDFLVIRLSPEEKRIGLSLKGVTQAAPAPSSHGEADKPVATETPAGSPTINPPSSIPFAKA